MDHHAALAAYNEQIRRNPVPDRPDGHTERADRVVRSLSGGGAWTGVTWSDLDQGSADAVIAEQIRRFAELGEPWEWKHYSYDQPADLPERLLAAGFTAEPPETMLIAELADLSFEVSLPAGITLRTVETEEDAAAMVTVLNEVFGGDRAHQGTSLLAKLARQPSTAAGVVAFAGSTPVSTARVEYEVGTEFAGIWGCGTLAAWRKRGLFRALVTHCCALAAGRGFRYVQADAMPDSRPIFGRLGFAEMATTTPYLHPGSP